jgi:hypothetical protein
MHTHADQLLTAQLLDWTTLSPPPLLPNLLTRAWWCSCWVKAILAAQPLGATKLHRQQHTHTHTHTVSNPASCCHSAR